MTMLKSRVVSATAETITVAVDFWWIEQRIATLAGITNRNALHELYGMPNLEPDDNEAVEDD